MTDHVDLRHNPLSDPAWIGSALDDSDHLVAGNPPKPAVACEKLEIRSADAGQKNAHECLTRFWFGNGDFFEAEGVIQDEC
jgi:hypothetical protein